VQSLQSRSSKVNQYILGLLGTTQAPLLEYVSLEAWSLTLYQANLVALHAPVLHDFTFRCRSFPWASNVVNNLVDFSLSSIITAETPACADFFDALRRMYRIERLNIDGHIPDPTPDVVDAVYLPHLHKLRLSGSFKRVAFVFERLHLPPRVQIALSCDGGYAPPTESHIFAALRCHLSSSNISLRSVSILATRQFSEIRATQYDHPHNHSSSHGRHDSPELYLSFTWHGSFEGAGGIIMRSASKFLPLAEVCTLELNGPANPALVDAPLLPKCNRTRRLMIGKSGVEARLAMLALHPLRDEHHAIFLPELNSLSFPGIHPAHLLTGPPFLHLKEFVRARYLAGSPIQAIYVEAQRRDGAQSSCAGAEEIKNLFRFTLTP
jgi:hypothetical protein